VAALPVAAEDRTGYQRDALHHWTDAADPPTVTGRYTLNGDRWYYWYDDQHVIDRRGLDIDHLIPLSEA
jgi:hypothetical protein